MKIILYRSKCIGCGSCAAVCPEFFEMVDDGLSHIKGASASNNEEILETGNTASCAKEAAEVCPVQIIEIA